jgi:hypothetical protein
MSGLYRQVRNPTHPLLTSRNAASSIYVHRFILYEKLGPGTHPCHWCGKLLTWGGRGSTSIQTDHVDGVKAHNVPANLVAACKRCNNLRRRRGPTIPVADAEIFVTLRRPDGRMIRHRAELRQCAACGIEFKRRLAEKRPGRGIYCSPRCRGKNGALARLRSQEGRFV